jgi:hypothetical protein
MALALAVVAPSLAAAQPTVRVRAEARIELRVSRDPGRVTVIGTLRDDLGQPLPDRRIDIRMLDDAQQLRGRATDATDAAGSLAASFPLEPGTYRVIARWEGDDGHQQVEVAQALDLVRAHVRLVVGLGGAGRIDLDRPEHHVDVRATSEEGGAGLRIEVRDELDRPLAEGRTDSGGTVRLTVSSTLLGDPAAGRLLVRTPGDERRAAAQTEVPVVRFRPSRIEIATSAQRVDVGEPLTLSGRLFDSAGALPRRAVGLFAGDRHLETVLTDDLGRFSRTVELSTEGLTPVVASYESDAPWRTSVRSEPVVVTVDAGGSPPWPWLLVPTLACAFAVAWLSRRPRPTAPSRDRESALPTAVGVEPTRPSSAIAQLRDVGGTVVDADDGRPIAGAIVALIGEGGRNELRTDEEGRFAWPEVDGTAWQLEVRAAGYQSTEAAIRVPHRGQWSGARVRLRSLREAALVQYRPVAEALAPQRKWWAFWTPRELVEHAGSDTRPEVEALTREVERAAYAASPPDDREVEAIADRAARVAQALGDRRG